MSFENSNEYAESELYPIQRLLPDLETGVKEIILGKKVAIQTFGRMSLLPGAEMKQPTKRISICIREACNQFQTAVEAQIMAHGSPKVLSIILRIGEKALIVYNETKNILNRDLIRQVERDLKAYIKLEDREEGFAVERIQADARDTATHAAMLERLFDREVVEDKKKKKRRKK